jgi:hypothetical protein
MVNGSVGRIASGWGLRAAWCVHGVCRGIVGGA